MAAGTGSPLKAIMYAFGANFGIAIAKSVAAAYTGSSSMLAEAIHSYADTGNQLLLLLGLRGAERPADDEHPLGYGKLSYFWSFMVAIILFSMGGLFSIYEGWHKLHAPEPIAHVWVALGVLGMAVVLEGLSLAGCLREVNKMRGERSLWAWIHEARTAELVVVLGEDFAAMAGLMVAFAFVLLAEATGDPRFDAWGSMAVGAILLAVSVFVAIRVKALLIGRSADPEIAAAIEELIAEDDSIVRVFNVITVQMGPRIMLAAKVRLRGEITVDRACGCINTLESKLKARFPELGWCFVEPDVVD